MAFSKEWTEFVKDFLKDKLNAMNKLILSNKSLLL
jgi:hypothetical protein